MFLKASLLVAGKLYLSDFPILEGFVQYFIKHYPTCVQREYPNTVCFYGGLYLITPAPFKKEKKYPFMTANKLTQLYEVIE